MFHIFRFHGPTLLSNCGPTVEVQRRWITVAIENMEHKKSKHTNSEASAAEAWKQRIIEPAGYHSSFPPCLGCNRTPAAAILIAYQAAATRSFLSWPMLMTCSLGMSNPTLQSFVDFSSASYSPTLWSS
jgi:hypothetical protein